MTSQENLKDITSLSNINYPFPNHLLEKAKDMKEFISKFWMLNRTSVNEDTDKLAKYLKDKLNAEIIKANSGEECLSWIIPENWKVKKAQLKTKNGQVVVDFEDNPLYLWTHSVSYKGEISKDELLDKHVSFNPKMPDEIIYHYKHGFKYKSRKWGFSIPYSIVKEMNEEKYLVNIETELNNGNTIKVVDAYLPGEKEDTIFIMAHTCHPAQVSDGIANIAVAIELFNYLKSLKKRKYSYRFLFGPEYFGSAAYLAKADKERISNLKFGIYLDMLSNHEVMGFQHSMQSNSLMDKILKNIFDNHLPIYIERPYRKLWGNDEMFFNGQSYLIPTTGVGRGMHRDYHHSSDNLENTDVYHLAESTWILMRVVQAFEYDFVPELKYSGPLYLSRYNLTFDAKVMENIEFIQALADGKNSCIDIAIELGLDIFSIFECFSVLEKNDLIEKKERISRQNDQGYLLRGSKNE